MLTLTLSLTLTLTLTLSLNLTLTLTKCGVGFLIYNITIAKSAALNEALLGRKK